MRKLIVFVMTAFMPLLFIPTPLKAIADIKAVSETTTVNADETDARIVRLHEIKATDVSTLSSSEKKELRKEVRAIKRELKVKGESTYIEGSHGGVYVSVGAAILIVLLLILLL